MNTKLLLAVLMAGTMATTACAQPAQPGPAAAAPAAPRTVLPGPEPIEHITGNVYKIFGGGGNTLVIVQKDGVILADTKLPGNGEAIMTEVRKVTDKPVKMIIHTHSHPDHNGSTDFIREQFPNVRIIMSRGAEPEVKNGNPKLLPTEYFDDHIKLFEGEDQIELIHTGVGHTGGDTFVLVPAARLLFMGDVMAWNMAPFLPAGGAEAIALETEKIVAAVDGKVDIVVEGHGHVNNWQALTRLAKFNRSLVNFARASYDRFAPPGTAVDELKKIPDYAPLLDTRIKKGLEYGNTPLARAHMNVNVAYTEFSGEPVGFGVANGAPLPETAKHKGSDPKDTAPPTAEMLANAVDR